MNKWWVVLFRPFLYLITESYLLRLVYFKRTASFRNFCFGDCMCPLYSRPSPNQLDLVMSTISVPVGPPSETPSWSADLVALLQRREISASWCCATTKGKRNIAYLWIWSGGRNCPVKHQARSAAVTSKILFFFLPHTCLDGDR